MRCTLPLLAAFVLCFASACSKKDDDAGGSSGKSTSTKNAPDAAKSGGGAPAYANPNTIELFAQVRAGFKKPMEDFAGTVKMESAFVGWYGDKLFLVLSKGKDTCDMFKPIRQNPPRFADQVKVSIALATLSKEQKTGAAPLKGTNTKVKDAVILAKGFNRMLSAAFGSKTNALRFDSGTIKVGETVTGSVYVHEKKTNLNAKYKPAFFKGSFKATVCEKFVKKLPKKQPLPPALGKCPDKTSLTALKSSIDISKEGPFDLATFTHAKAMWKNDHATLKVFIANHPWTAKQMGSLMSPIKQAGKAFVEVRFYQKDVWATIGEYKRGGYKQPFTTSASIGVLKRGIGISFKEASAKIIDMRNGKVCGTFDFKGTKNALAGTFVADLPEK